MGTLRFAHPTSEVPDWRWGLAGETTPWYPSLRLFRQTQRGDWAGVMVQVGEALEQWIS